MSWANPLRYMSHILRSAMGVKDMFGRAARDTRLYVRSLGGYLGTDRPDDDGA